LDEDVDDEPEDSVGREGEETEEERRDREWCEEQEGHEEEAEPALPAQVRRGMELLEEDNERLQLLRRQGRAAIGVGEEGWTFEDHVMRARTSSPFTGLHRIETLGRHAHLQLPRI
jgi:hypothetical protein